MNTVDSSKLWICCIIVLKAIGVILRILAGIVVAFLKVLGVVVGALLLGIANS